MEQGIKASKSIGANIKAARIAKKMTQEQLSSKLQTLGCDMSRGTLAKVEAGIRHVSVEELRSLKIILEFEYDKVFE